MFNLYIQYKLNMSNKSCANPFDITKHVDYERHMANYISKEKCQSMVDSSSVPAPSQGQGKAGPITQHPDFKKLMGKYATLDKTVCPPQYKPCKQLADYNIEDHPDFKNYVKASVAQAETQQLLQKQNKKYLSEVQRLNQKIVELNQAAQKMVSVPLSAAKKKELCDLNEEMTDISKHPDYKKLMSKYATLDKTVCPPQYKPCPPPKTIADFHIRNHPDFKNYIEKKVVEQTLQKRVQELTDQHKKQVTVLLQKIKQLEAARQNYVSVPLSEEDLKKHCPPGKSLADYDIRQHPDFKKIMSKYALRDNTTCPPSYKECKPCPKCPPQQECKCPPQKTIADFPIQSHPDFKKLMSKYAIKDNSTCPPKFIPCKPCPPQKKIGDFPIQSHPDFDQYISKEEARRIIVAELAKRKPDVKQLSCPPQRKCPPQRQCPPQKTIGNFPIQSHPDFGNYISRDEAKRIMMEELNKLRAQMGRKIPIEQHPDYKALMEKYACKDDKTCPPTWRPAKCTCPRPGKCPPCPECRQKIGPISEHPDFNQYISKEEAKRLMKQELQKCQKTSIGRIEDHPDYKNLMDQYACKDDKTCPPSYKKCKMCTCPKCPACPKCPQKKCPECPKCHKPKPQPQQEQQPQRPPQQEQSQRPGHTHHHTHPHLVHWKKHVDKQSQQQQRPSQQQRQPVNYRPGRPLRPRPTQGHETRAGEFCLPQDKPTGFNKTTVGMLGQVSPLDPYHGLYPYDTQYVPRSYTLRK